MVTASCFGAIEPKTQYLTFSTVHTHTSLSFPYIYIYIYIYISPQILV